MKTFSILFIFDIYIVNKINKDKLILIFDYSVIISFLNF
jgi:hypothetical protein